MNQTIRFQFNDAITIVFEETIDADVDDDGRAFAVPTIDIIDVQGLPEDVDQQEWIQTNIGDEDLYEFLVANSTKVVSYEPIEGDDNDFIPW
jgi:hypothetical protein